MTNLTRELVRRSNMTLPLKSSSTTSGHAQFNFDVPQRCGYLAIWRSGEWHALQWLASNKLKVSIIEAYIILHNSQNKSQVACLSSFSLLTWMTLSHLISDITLLIVHVVLVVVLTRATRAPVAVLFSLLRLPSSEQTYLKPTRIELGHHLWRWGYHWDHPITLYT